MVEELDRASPDRQASWVALKTLRQRPTVVGRTDEGATVYEVRSVRLVLSPGSAHFKRLVPCAKCGRDVPGSPVFGPADLDHPPNSVFCDRCGRTVDSPRPLAPVEAGRPGAAEARQTEVPSPAPSPVEGAGDLRRLSEQVADLLRGQNAELAKLSASVAEVRAEMRKLGESNRELEHAQRELDQRMNELAAHSHAEIEEKLARELAEVGTGLAAALTQGLDPLRSEMAALQQRVDESVGARQLAELRAGVVDTIGAEDAKLRVEVAERLGLLRAEIALLEQRTQGEFAAVSELLEGQRKELTEALDDVAQETLMSVAEPLRDLTKAREDFDRRLDSAAHQLARLVELQSQAPPPAPVSRRVPGDMMESLERQLQAAELRLRQTTGDAGDE